MVVQVRLPSPLRRLADGQARVTAVGQSVREVLNDLGRQYPGIEERLYDGGGSLRRYINIYLNGQDIHGLDGENTLVGDGDEITIMPSIAGG